MLRFAPCFLFLAAHFLPSFVAFGQQQPQPPAQLTAEQKQQYQAKVNELDGIVAGLRSKKVNEDLIADVDIYAKAGKWLLEFPQGFTNEKTIPAFLNVLDQGLERGRLLQKGESPWVTAKGRKVLGYYSELDGSVQPMGVTIPESHDASKAARLYVWIHGRNNTLTEASFISNIGNAPKFPNTSYTADLGQLTLDCYGRGNNANHQAGEVDVFESMAAMQRRFKIDPERILLRGFSLGGAAAWHLALQQPDRWAAAEIGAGTYPGRLLYSPNPFPPYQLGPLHIYENIIDWSLNAYNVPIAGHDGDKDPQVATVGAPRGSAPTPNRGQLESSLRVRAQLEKEGFPSEGAEGDWTVKGTQNRFFISANTGHGVNAEVRGKLDAFLKEHSDKGRQVPDHIKFVTYTTRYNKSFWVMIDGLEKHYDRAQIDAERVDGGTEYRLATKNITRLTLRETSKAKTLTIDGQTLTAKAAPSLTLQKMDGKWSFGKTGAWPGLHKTHGLQGPIDDAFLEPFLLIRPTQMPWNAAATKHALAMMEHFDHVYAMNYRAHPRWKNDEDVTKEDFKKYNVVLFGDPGSNKWIGKMIKSLPLKWTKDAITIEGRTYPAGENLPVLVYPNPLNPSKYVVLNTGLTISDREYNADYAMPRFGDIAVLKAGAPMDAPEIVWAALFDESWRLPVDSRQ